MTDQQIAAMKVLVGQLVAERIALHVIIPPPPPISLGVDLTDAMKARLFDKIRGVLYADFTQPADR
jgi:hypothetical protein